MTARRSETRGSLARVLALGLALMFAYALAGCSGSRGAPPPSATPPAAEPPPAAGTPPPTTPPASGVPRASGPITAPWDTAAQSRDTRRLHVYPEGESDLSRRLLASIPEPSATGSSSPPPTRSSPTPTSPPPPPASPPAPGSCWEVQILTTIDKGKAEDVRDEAERTLNVAAWVRSSDGIHRVRIGGCLTMSGAAELAERVRRSGYPEAFRAKREL